MANTLRFVNGQLLFDPNDPDSLAYKTADCKCCRCCYACHFNCNTTISDYYEILWLNDSFYGPLPYTRYTGTGVIGNKTTGPLLDGNCEFCMTLEEWSYIGPLPWTAGDELVEANWSLVGPLANDLWMSMNECGWISEVNYDYSGTYNCRSGIGTCSGTVTILCGDPYTLGNGTTGEFTVNNPDCDPLPT